MVRPLATYEPRGLFAAAVGQVMSRESAPVWARTADWATVAEETAVQPVAPVSKDGLVTRFVRAVPSKSVRVDVEPPVVPVQAKMREPVVRAVRPTYDASRDRRASVVSEPPTTLAIVSTAASLR